MNVNVICDGEMYVCVYVVNSGRFSVYPTTGENKQVCVWESQRRVSVLPGACSKGSCESSEYAPEEGVWVLPRKNKVDCRQHKKTMDGMSDDTARYIFSQTGK